MAMSTYSCFCFTRKFKIAEVQPPDDVRMVFEAYADGVGNGGGPTISAEGLRRFLLESQGEKGISSAELTRIMEKFRGVDTTTGAKHYLEKMVKHGAPNFLGIEEFYHFLFSIDFNPPIKHEVHQDMTLPISHYYVFTGHNSYLTGNQLSSDCSDAPIIKALQKGVRVIELDMWPNSTKDNIDILHGRTLTSPVEIIKCLRSIKEYAFCATPYPLVITLEDHLTPDLQAKVAEMIKETFGEMLYIPSDEPMKEFPSPEDLKNRIIISTKPPKEYLEAKDNRSSGSQNKDSNGSVTTERYSDVVAEVASGKDVSDSRSEASYDKDEEESEDEEEEYQKFGKDTANQYRKLIAIQAGKCKGSLKDALHIDPARVRRISFGEQKLIKACTSYSADVIRFTQRNILRVYPKGTRVRSTNYKPMLAWTHGVQMVAFNTQRHGKQLRIMQGFFKANGGCGYVRKPDFLMTVGPNGEVFDPSVPLPVKQTLKVKIYMGDGWRMDFSKTHFDTYSPPDFYAKIVIEGVPTDMLGKKTKVIEDNWVPVWDEEFSFPLTVPELAILRIEVKDYNMSEKHDFGGQTCLPVSELRPGIRAVPLYDKKGSVYKSVRLLMRFKFV